jgi:membrane protease YdiL (CAAX protease family)
MTVRSVIDRHAVPNWLLVYGSLIVLSEAAIVLLGIGVGATFHALVLLGLAAHNTFSRTPKDPQIPTLLLLPLTRLLSLVMPIATFPPVTWYALTGLPALLATLLVMRAIGMTATGVGLGRPASIGRDAFLALFGIPLGLLLGSTAVGTQRPLADADLLVFAIVALPFIVVLEELIFRGVIQRVATARAPNLAILIPNVLYAAMYLGAGNGVAALVMGGFGVLLSAMTATTGSLWGAIGAHFLMRLILHIGLTLG